MKKKWFRRESYSLLSKDGFIKNVFVLVTGTAAVQVLNFALTPFITRLYGAEAFGVFGLFSSILNFMTVMSALCYPIAIIFVKEEQQYKNLVAISIKLTFLLGLILSLALLLLTSNFTFAFNDIALYLCLGLLPASLATIYSQIMLRNKKFRVMAYIGFVTALIVAASKISAGFFYPTSVALIYSAILGFGVSALIMHFVIFGNSISLKMPLLNATEISVMKEFKQFPFFRLPHALLAALSQIVPVALLTSYFGLAAAGYFVLTRSVLMVPVTLLGKAVYDVSYPKLSADFGVKPITKFLVYTTLGLMIVSSIPLLILLLWGQELFSLVFGEDWSRAGLYAGCMSFWFVFNISNRPCVGAVSLLGLDKFLLVNSIFNLVFSVLGFIVAFYIWGTDTAAILSFYLCATLAQVFLILKVLLAGIKSDRQIFTDVKS
jgi:O-antigen/teichoic acid export membrane protein